MITSRLKPLSWLPCRYFSQCSFNGDFISRLVRPTMAFIGVRISWLIFARNCWRNCFVSRWGCHVMDNSSFVFSTPAWPHSIHAFFPLRGHSAFLLLLLLPQCCFIGCSQSLKINPENIKDKLRIFLCQRIENIFLISTVFRSEPATIVAVAIASARKLSKNRQSSGVVQAIRSSLENFH